MAKRGGKEMAQRMFAFHVMIIEPLSGIPNSLMQDVTGQTDITLQMYALNVIILKASDPGMKSYKPRCSSEISISVSASKS